MRDVRIGFILRSHPLVSAFKDRKRDCKSTIKIGSPARGPHWSTFFQSRLMLFILCLLDLGSFVLIEFVSPGNCYPAGAPHTSLEIRAGLHARELLHLCSVQAHRSRVDHHAKLPILVERTGHGGRHSIWRPHSGNFHEHASHRCAVSNPDEFYIDPDYEHLIGFPGQWGRFSRLPEPLCTRWQAFMFLKKCSNGCHMKSHITFEWLGEGWRSQWPTVGPKRCPGVVVYD